MGSSFSFCFHIVLLVCRNATDFHTWTVYPSNSLDCSFLTGGLEILRILLSEGDLVFILCSCESFACLVAVSRDWCSEMRQNLVLGKLGIGTGEMGTRNTVWPYSWLLSLRWVSLTQNQRSQHHKPSQWWWRLRGQNISDIRVLWELGLLFWLRLWYSSIWRVWRSGTYLILSISEIRDVHFAVHCTDRWFWPEFECHSSVLQNVWACFPWGLGLE